MVESYIKGFYLLPTRFIKIFDHYKSYNNIRKIENIGTLTKLKKLFFAGNKISKIENLETLTELTMLELGANRIRKIENLDKNINLGKCLPEFSIRSLDQVANTKRRNFPWEK